MTDCVLLAELGANPAALVEALWALVRQRGMRVCAAFVLASARGVAYLEAEVLRAGAAYDDRAALHVSVAPFPDEFSPAAAATMQGARNPPRGRARGRSTRAPGPRSPKRDAPR